jgi:hypothetical protein
LNFHRLAKGAGLWETVGMKKKGPKGQRISSNVTAPKVRDMVKAAKKAKKRPAEDFSQAAARIVREATEGH